MLCPRCYSELVQDTINPLHLRCVACERRSARDGIPGQATIVILGTGGPRYGCETCGRRLCSLRQADSSLADCPLWRRKRVRPAEQPGLFDGDDEDYDCA